MDNRMEKKVENDMETEYIQKLGKPKGSASV